MTLEQPRAAAVMAVDRLVTRLYLAARTLSDDGLKDLLTQAALSLAEPVPPLTLLGRLDVVRALVRIAIDDPHQRQSLERASVELAAALRRSGRGPASLPAQMTI